MDHTTTISCIKEQRDQRPMINGNKYFIFSPGKTFKIKEDIIRNVLEQLSGQLVPEVEECDAILVFCFIVSRTRTDIDVALNGLNALSESKPAVFMVFHPTFEPEKVVLDSSRYVNRVNTLAVDCLFNEDDGLLKCVNNGGALFKVLQRLQPRGKIGTWLAKVSSYFKAESELVLVLLGMSGPEKTAVEHMILGREESQAETSPATQMKITVDTGEVDGEQVAVINTPDWFSSELSIEEIQRKIQFCIRLSSSGPYAFLLVIPAKQFSEEERKIVKKMEIIFEERCREKIMILFTVNDEQQRQNIQDHDLQALVKKGGNQFHVLNISETGNESQVSDLLKVLEKIQGNYEALNNPTKSPEDGEGFVLVDKDMLDEKNPAINTYVKV